MNIKIDKKYIACWLTDNHRVGDSVTVKIACAIITDIVGDEYTLEIPDTEREEFIEECSIICDYAILTEFEKLYDAGARFK